MKRIVLMLVLIGLLAVPALAFADGTKPLGIYAGGHLGMSIENISGRKLKDTDKADPLSVPFSSKTDTVFGGGVSVGYDFDPQLGAPVRVELDYTARARGEGKSGTYGTYEGEPFDITKKDKISLQTLMLNVWVDIPTGTPVTPYLGGGVGVGFVGYKTSFDGEDENDEHKTYKGSSHESNFAWSLGAGVAYDVTENWTVDLGYRYIDAGKVSKTFSEAGEIVKSKAKVQTHDVMLGVRYTF